MKLALERPYAVAANHLCTYAHQTQLSEFVFPK